MRLVRATRIRDSEGIRLRIRLQVPLVLETGFQGVSNSRAVKLMTLCTFFADFENIICEGK